MKNIRFSHVYSKMPDNPHPSMLLEVFVVDDDLHPKFVSYDTSISGGGKYKLPGGKKLVLLLQTLNGDLWTTVRRYSDEKCEYYRSTRGTMFGIVVKEMNRSLDNYV